MSPIWGSNPYATSPPARNPYLPNPSASSAPRTPRYQPTSSRNPPSAHRCRVPPKGIYLSNWKRSGLPIERSNAVYGSRDSRNYINRRISKENAEGQVKLGGKGKG